MSNEVVSAFRRALDEAPGSIRSLAEAAGLSDGLLIRVRDGERALTPETVQAVVGALRAWGDRCHALADAIEAAAQVKGESDAT